MTLNDTVAFMDQHRGIPESPIITQARNPTGEESPMRVHPPQITQANADALREKNIRRAFSLAELLVVLTILGVMATVAALSFSQSVARQRVEGAARRVHADLEFAKRNAKLKGVDQTVTFSEQSGRYIVVNVPHPDHTSKQYYVDLWQEPYCVNELAVDFDGTKEVTFDPYGVPASGGTITLRVGRLAVTVSVDGETGNPKNLPIVALTTPDIGGGGKIDTTPVAPPDVAP